MLGEAVDLAANKIGMKLYSEKDVTRLSKKLSKALRPPSG